MSRVWLPGQRQRRDGTRDYELVFNAKKRKPQKRRSRVKRRGQRRGMHDAGAAAGLDKCHLFIPADFVFHTDATVELDQVGAYAKQNVLAVVNHFASARMFVRRSAAAEIRPALEHGDAKSGIGQRASRGEASQAAAGYGYGGLCGGVSHSGFKAASYIST